MERYGFFGGSFNPVTTAHINIAKLAKNEYNLDKIIFVPMGNHYQKKDLIKEEYRYTMLKLATKEEEDLEVSDIELNLEKGLTMVQAFEKIKEQYKNIEQYFIIGADNIKKLTLQPNLEKLASNYKYIIVSRDDIDTKQAIIENPILKHFKTHFYILKNNPYKEISSTNARNILKTTQYENISRIIPYEIHSYIKENNLY